MYSLSIYLSEQKWHNHPKFLGVLAVCFPLVLIIPSSATWIRVDSSCPNNRNRKGSPWKIEHTTGHPVWSPWKIENNQYEYHMRFLLFLAVLMPSSTHLWGNALVFQVQHTCPNHSVVCFFQVINNLPHWILSFSSNAKFLKPLGLSMVCNMQFTEVSSLHTKNIPALSSIAILCKRELNLLGFGKHNNLIWWEMHACYLCNTIN